MNHYVATDIHGNLEMFNKMMEYLEAQEDGYVLYYLGDAADRGKDGYEIISKLLDNPNVIYIKGNHEDLFVRAAFEYADLAMEYDCTKKELVKQLGGYQNVMRSGADLSLYAGNGGAQTFKSWIKNGCKMTIVYKLKSLPVKASYDIYDMCHAGCTPEEWDENNESAMLWDREHFLSPWKDGRVLIHGHTPIIHLREDWHVEPYYEEQKYDLDTGCWHTGILSIMRLEDREIITFTQNEDISFEI